MRTLAAEVLSYLPTESFFALAACADVFVVADDVQFSTNRNINRTRLKTATSVQWLTIPILTKGRHGQRLHEVEIDPTREWQRQHWRTIQLNYHNAPYFGELADELESLYQQPYQKLAEVTWTFLQFLWRILHWEKLPPRTSEFHLTHIGAQRVRALARAVDAGVYLTSEKYRAVLQPELMPDLQLRFINLALPPYHQQFGGFVSELNLLDLLFNEGVAFTRQRIQAWRNMMPRISLANFCHDLTLASMSQSEPAIVLDKGFGQNESFIAMPKIVAIIPAFDEEKSVGKVVQAIPQPPVEKIIVVNNNSRDRTAEVAAQAGALVVFEGEPGYGAACLRGIAEAKKCEAELVVFLDADHSDYPEEIPDLIAPILTGRCDFVIGSRALGEKEAGAMTPQQVFGNWLACHLMRLLLGARYSDLGPFRAISMAALEKLQMCDRNYGWTVEMQIKAALQHLRVAEVPARYRRRIGKSKISGTVKGTVLAGWKIITTILRYGIFR